MKKTHFFLSYLLMLGLISSLSSCATVSRQHHQEVVADDFVTEKLIKKNERYYQRRWCNTHGSMEVVLVGRSRVDCLTNTHAIEFDWANKWYEAVGQSLFYAQLTKKHAGIVLIVRKPKYYKYWKRLNEMISYHQLKIDTWLIVDYEGHQ